VAGLLSFNAQAAAVGIRGTAGAVGIAGAVGPKLVYLVCLVWEKKRGQATFLTGCGERKPVHSIFRVWSKNDLPLEGGLDGLPLRVSNEGLHST
jgi:hypothetical protein